MSNEQKLINWIRQLTKAIQDRSDEIPRDLELLLDEKHSVEQSMSALSKFKDLTILQAKIIENIDEKIS